MRKTFTSCNCLRNRHVENILWFLSTCRNAFAVILGCVIAYSCELYGYQPFNLTGFFNNLKFYSCKNKFKTLNFLFINLGEIKSGIPSFHLPPFSYERPVSNSSISNSTGPHPGFELVTFDTILSDLGTGLAMVPIIAILEQVAIAKAFCK